MMITQRIGHGPESFEVSVSDIYGDPVKEFSEYETAWNLVMSRRWCPQRMPKGWWWKKWVS